MGEGTGDSGEKNTWSKINSRVWDGGGKWLEAGEDSGQGWVTQSEKLGLLAPEGELLAHIHRKGSELGEPRWRNV